MQTISPEAVQMKPEGYDLPGFRAKFFETMETEANLPICHIYAGYFAKGELLSVNIYGRNREECIEALSVLQTLRKETEAPSC